MSESPVTPATKANRTFLVVVDETEEMKVALRYASRRAKATGGRVALLYVIDPSEFEHFMGVRDIMREEKRQEAEETLKNLADVVAGDAGQIPVVYLREGNRRDELLEVLDEEPGISILVLGAGTGPEGPGPLISHLIGKAAGRVHVPITIVPGNLTQEQLDAVT
ncbi:MAG: universal stress protein [Alphaproteobacteria bacterium]|nr:universal stress protein [Alphaproteobacteria bacterium]